MEVVGGRWSVVGAQLAFPSPAGRLSVFSSEARFCGLHRPHRGRYRGGAFLERSEIGLFFLGRQVGCFGFLLEATRNSI